MRIQCSWMFCRSVMSARSRPYVGRDVGDDAQLLAGQRAAVDADAHHEELVLELLGLQRGGLAAGDARAALGVQAVPAEPAAQVARVDAGEAGVLVDVDDALPDQQAVVVALGALVRVQRFAVAEGPLALSSDAQACACPFDRWLSDGSTADGDTAAQGASTARAGHPHEVDVAARRQRARSPSRIRPWCHTCGPARHSRCGAAAMSIRLVEQGQSWP